MKERLITLNWIDKEINRMREWRDNWLRLAEGDPGMSLLRLNQMAAEGIARKGAVYQKLYETYRKAEYLLEILQDQEIKE